MPTPRTLALALSFVAATTLGAQGPRTIAERLGHPRNTKLLIIHADDIGVSHSVNAATFDAMASGAVTSFSAMMPTPWVTELAQWVRTHPDADVGLHLTLTSEWNTYRWGPLAPRDGVPTLLDSMGTFRTRETDVRQHVSAEDAEREIRAQIAFALQNGIRPTHLDSHMGSLFTRADLYAVLAKVAREHGLPFLATSDGRGRGTLQPPMLRGEIVLDQVVTIGPDVPAERWKQWYLDQVRALQPGLTEMIVHVGRDDAELRAVMQGFDAWGSAWRQRDFDVLSSAEFRQALRDNGVVLVTWRDLQRVTVRP